MLKLFSKKDKVKRPAKPFKKRAKEVLGRVIKSRELYLMIIPVMIFYVIFAYVPMYGIIIAWKDYLPKKGIVGSDWVGWKWFLMFFQRPEMFRALKNIS